MSLFRTWLLSFTLAVVFAAGVVAVVFADPMTMMAEEDHHPTDENEHADDAPKKFHGYLLGNSASLMSNKATGHGRTMASKVGIQPTDGPTIEYRTELHRPPSA